MRKKICSVAVFLLLLLFSACSAEQDKRKSTSEVLNKEERNSQKASSSQEEQNTPTDTVKQEEPNVKKNTDNQEEPNIQKDSDKQEENIVDKDNVKQADKAKVFADINATVTAGIIFDQNETMYVARDGAIDQLTPDGTRTLFCSFEELTDRKNYYFNSPLVWDMAFDNQGNILAAAQDRILRITKDGAIETIIREDFKGFLGASGIECDRQGNFYITNGDKIEKYTPELEKTTLIDGGKNSYFGFFSLELDPEEKNLYVTDFYTKSLIKYEIDANGNASGPPVEIIREPVKNSGNFGAPLNITFSESSNMYVSIDGMAKIMKLDIDGAIEFLDLGDNISNHIIAFGGKGFEEESIYITTFDGKKIYQYDIGEKAKK